MEKNQKIIEIDLIEFSSSSIDDEELKTVSASGHRRRFVHTLTHANFLSPTQLAYMHASAQVRTRRICCVLTVSFI